jgi:hypothetical protein
MRMSVSGASGALQKSSRSSAVRDKGTRLRELAYRANDGLEVALLWSELEDRLAVSVSDVRSGERFVLDAENDKRPRRLLPPICPRHAAGRGRVETNAQAAGRLPDITSRRHAKTPTGASSPASTCRPSSKTGRRSSACA